MRPDPILHDYARQASDIELAIAAATADLVLNQAVAVFLEHPEWPKFTERLKEILAGLTQGLLTKRMDQHEMGFHQGYARALQVLLTRKPWSAQEVDQVREDISIQTERLAELRNLLN